MSEIWKTVPSQPHWEASTHGRVRRAPFQGSGKKANRTYGGKPLIGSPSGARLSVMYKRRGYAVHRLVCEAFHGPAPADKPLCMHLDEDFRNNRPENLQWGTQRENLNAPGYLAFLRSESRRASLRKGWETRRAG